MVSITYDRNQERGSDDRDDEGAYESRASRSVSNCGRGTVFGTVVALVVQARGGDVGVTSICCASARSAHVRALVAAAERRLCKQSNCWRSEERGRYTVYILC